MTQRHWIRCACAALVGAVVLAGTPVAVAGSPAEDLARRLPDELVAFVATSGGAALKEDFEKTALGRIYNDPGVRSFYQAVKAQVLAKVQQGTGGADRIKQIDMALGLAQLAAGRPAAVGVAQLKGPAQNEDKPPVYAFAILDAGAHKAEFDGAIKTLETLIGAEWITDVNVGSARMRGPKDESDLPLYWGWSGNYLVVAVFDAAGAAMQYLQKPRAAAPAYLKKVPTGGDALVVHADIRKAIGMIDTVVRQEDAEAAGAMAAVLKELGLSGVRTFTSRSGFAGSDLVTSSFLEVAGPRTGLLAVMKGIDPAVMDLVDARAMTAGAVNLDAAGAYDTILRAIKAASGQAYADVEKGLETFESQVQLNVRKSLLESLAGPVVFYTLGIGAVPESPLGGGVALIKLKDAELFEKTLTALADFAAAQSKGVFQVGTQPREEGRTVHTWVIPQLAMMQVMPTWSITKDYAVIGSNAALHDLVVRRMASTGAERKSIRDTAGYQEAGAKLPDNVVSLSYADSRAQYTQLLGALQQLWPMAAMFAAQADIRLPPLLPSLGGIIKDMKPSCRCGWVGPDGFYMQYQGPGLDVSLSKVAGVSLGMGVLMPALARTRQLAFRMTSGTNLSGIGKACLIYAREHEGRLPPDLQTLVQEVDLSPKTLVSKLKPDDFGGPSYLYISGQTLAMPPGNVVAYDNPEFCTEGVNVLFLDGHVEFMKPEAFREALKTTCERLGREMPEIKFKDEAEVKPRVPRLPMPGRPSQA